MEDIKPTTLERIHSAAKREFLEKGFLGASLRNIVKSAGVTTGAFYGYYDSKEKLFDALVSDKYEHIMGMYVSTQNSFKELDAGEQQANMGKISGDCLEQMIDYMYASSGLYLCALRGQGMRIWCMRCRRLKCRRHMTL